MEYNTENNGRMEQNTNNKAYWNTSLKTMQNITRNNEYTTGNNITQWHYKTLEIRDYNT